MLKMDRPGGLSYVLGLTVVNNTTAATETKPLAINAVDAPAVFQMRPNKSEAGNTVMPNARL